MAIINRVDDEHSAAALADLLNGNRRRRPIAVVTIPSGREEPWIDVEELAREAGRLAEVYLMPTSAPTWEFSRRMAEGTQVYGGAGRVYPVGHEWTTNLSKSPLRFAFHADDGRRATQDLISDLLRMAAAAGLLLARPATTQRAVEGTVRMVVAGRALVDIGNITPATIAEELTTEDVPIDRLLAEGQRIAGSYDPETNRLDVRAMLRSADEALASYTPGDTVLAQVAMVRNGKAELLLYPKTTTPAVSAAVLRADVTSNALDDLRTLMTPGEVVAARVVAAGPRWRLALNDVEDDDPVAPAPALLPGGPPWLTDEGEAPGEEDHDEFGALLPMPVGTAPAGEAEPELLEEPAAAAPMPDAGAAPAAPRPSPAMFGLPTPSRPAAVDTVEAVGTVERAGRGETAAEAEPAPAAAPVPGPVPRPPGSPVPATAPASPPAPSESTRSLLLKIDGYKAEVARLERVEAEVASELTELRAELQVQRRAADEERDQLRYLLGKAERRLGKAEHELKGARSRLRKAGNSKAARTVPDEPRFADPEQGFRYWVLTQWATRTLPGEQADRPLPDYDLGPRFLDSLAALEGIKERKVADVVFEILTGLAAQNPSRELHRLRSGPGGEDPVRVRDEDGAHAWRASLQVKTPAARRLHYWVLPSGRIELARVATHDDFEA